jgi:hypothetical protein
MRHIQRFNLKHECMKNCNPRLNLDSWLLLGFNSSLLPTPTQWQRTKKILGMALQF